MNVTRWRPALDVGEVLDPSTGARKGLPYIADAVPQASHPDGPPRGDDQGLKTQDRRRSPTPPDLLGSQGIP